MSFEYDPYLVKQGYTVEQAKQYQKLMEKGISPQKAVSIITETKATTNPVVHEYVQKTSPEQEYAVETTKAEFQPQTGMEKIFGRKITTQDVENAAGKAVSKAHQITKEELKSLSIEAKKLLKPKPLTKEEVMVERAKAQGRASIGGYGGYSLARQPTKVKIVRTMKPPAHQDLPGDDMGMSIGNTSLVSSLSGIDSGGRKEPTQFRMHERQPVGRIQVNGTNPVNDNRSENLVRFGNTGTPMGNMRMGSGNAESLVSLGTVKSPVNVNVRATSTRIPQQKQINVKFKGRKPKTATKKPRIETKVVTEKMFWEP